MPSGDAYRPGDVLTMYGGKTVEVLNTDAEGRLVLADAMVRACEENPDYLIDTATLTGAAVVALGKRTAGVLAPTSSGTGSPSWATPSARAAGHADAEELRSDLDSRLADMANVTGHRWGGMLAGRAVPEGVRAGGPAWAHIDVAGRPTTPAAPSATSPRAAPACRSAPSRRPADIAANG